MSLDGPRPSPAARLDDRGVAAVVGFVLLFAAVTTWYAYVAHNDVPRWGADAEERWDRQVGDAMLRIDRSAAGSVGESASLTVLVPPAPSPRGVDIPLLGGTTPTSPSGSLSFVPACGGVTAIHSVDGSSIPDLVGGARGCLVFRSQPTYSDGFGYRTEFGGMLRVQGERAGVLTGPPLELVHDASTHTYRVSLTLVGLRGQASSFGADRAGVAVDLVPGSSAAEVGHVENAANVYWTFRTSYPEAWKTWFNDRIAQAGFNTDHNHACTRADASCASLASDEVFVILRGPDFTTNALDVSLSLSYGEYEVALR